MHALLHMADAGRALTSEELAAMLSTNAVVVRRTMAGLREAKLVRSTKGHGGGWELARALAEIRLVDIYAALDEPAVFAMAAEIESPGCLVEKAVHRTMTAAFAHAHSALMTRLSKVTLAEIAADVHATGHRMGVAAPALRPKQKPSKPRSRSSTAGS
jgi:Rrf2 family protein